MSLPEFSPALLKSLAAAVWLIGAGELLFKGQVLLREAEALSPSSPFPGWSGSPEWPWGW